MQPTNHQGTTGAIPDRTRDQNVLVESNLAPSQTQNSAIDPRDRNERDDDEGGGVDPEPAWQPRFDRRQSWNHQDRKHQLQERLLNVEGSRERGFTETNRGV